MGDLKTVAFSDFDDDVSSDVGILQVSMVTNADFDSMMTNGRQTLDDLQRVADVVVSGCYRLPVVMEFVIFLNE